MIIEEILALGDFEKIMKALAIKQSFEYVLGDALAEYDPTQHLIMDTTKRVDKTKKKKSTAPNPDGSSLTETEVVAVARIQVPFQRVIVERVVGLFLGNPVRMKQIASNGVEVSHEADAIVSKYLNENKMDYKNRTIARSVFATMECAEIWYMVDNLNALPKEPKFKLKMAIVSPLTGDALYPHYDLYGDMDAFSRGYTLVDGDKKIECFDIYTSTTTMKGKKDGSWVVEQVPNNIAKIPIVYYRQQAPEWSNVQKLIERYELVLSNFADTNDYFGSPMVVLKGEVLGFADKDETGKIIKLKGDNASASYLTWNQAPEAIKLELETLRHLIFTLSMTHDIGSDVAKGLGAPSTQSMKFMFLDPLNKVKTKEEIFGEGYQRRINVIKEFVAVIDTASSKFFEGREFVPLFTPAIPENEKEEVDNIANAVTAGIMSIQSAVNRNPLVDNPQEEVDLIKQDKAESMAATFNMNQPAVKKSSTK